MSNRIKVLHVIGALNLGGAETMAVNIMRNIDRSRFQFDFYLSGNSGGYYEPEVERLGGQITNVGRRMKHPVRYCMELYRLIRKEKYDVVQVHATDAQDGLPAVIARLAGAKKICLYSHNSAGQSPSRQKWMRRFFMWAVTDPQACSDLAAEWMFGKKSRDVKIIPLPINCDKCKFDPIFRMEERKKWNVTSNKVIGHIGRFQTQKNHSRMLDIFSEVVKMDPNYRLMLIGTGNLQAEIIEKIKSLGLDDHVIMMGQVDGACVELSMFDLMLLPSLYEGFPTVLLEAQANGLPILASDTITSTIALTDLITFQSLKESDRVWAETVICCKNRKKDVSAYHGKIAHTYDVKTVTKTFEDIYLTR